MSMTITNLLFEAFLRCPTKCFLRALGKAGNENAYSDWLRTQNASYCREAIKCLMECASKGT